jgi:hypothetical protein
MEKTGEIIIISIVTIPIVLLFLGIGITYVVGKGNKGEFLLAGWNTLSAEKRARYNKEALFTFLGWVFIVSAVLTVIFMAGVIFESPFILWTSGVAWLVVLLGGVIYSNMGKRFRNPLSDDANNAAVDDDPQEKRRKKVLFFVTFAFTLVTGFVILWFFCEGSRPITVSLDNQTLVIPGVLYGVSVPFDEIQNVGLLDESMRQIGAGRRNAGHGTNNNLRGSFAAGHLLVQNPSEGPTIRIERLNDRPLFISLDDSQATRALYQRIAGSVPR